MARRLAAFQRDLDLRLVDQTPDGPRLTAEATQLVRLAEQMETAADAIQRRLASEIWLVIHRDLRRSPRTVAVADHIVEVLARAAPLLEGR